MEIRRPQTEYAPLTHAQVEALRQDALRPDYGSKYYKPATVLALIATLDAQAFAPAVKVAAVRVTVASEGQLGLFS